MVIGLLVGGDESLPLHHLFLLFFFIFSHLLNILYLTFFPFFFLFLLPFAFSPLPCLEESK